MVEKGWQAQNPANQLAPYKILNPLSQPVQLGSSKEQVTALLPPCACATSLVDDLVMDVECFSHELWRLLEHVAVALYISGDDGDHATRRLAGHALA